MEVEEKLKWRTKTNVIWALVNKVLDDVSAVINMRLTAVDQ